LRTLSGRFSESVLFFLQVAASALTNSYRKGFSQMISEQTKEYYQLGKKNDVRESAKRLRRRFLRHKDAEIVCSIQHMHAL
jgi:hypothetical protein